MVIVLDLTCLRNTARLLNLFKQFEGMPTGSSSWSTGRVVRNRDQPEEGRRNAEDADLVADSRRGQGVSERPNRGVSAQRGGSGSRPHQSILEIARALRPASPVRIREATKRACSRPFFESKYTIKEPNRHVNKDWDAARSVQELPLAAVSRRLPPNQAAAVAEPHLAAASPSAHTSAANPRRRSEPVKEPDPAVEQYETLKRHIHMQLVDRLDMNRVSEMDPKTLRNEIRGDRRAPLRHRESPAQSQRAPAAGQRDPRRDLRLRPARALAQGRQDRRHHDQRSQEDLHRKGGANPEVGSRLSRQRAPASDHRPDRLAGRPAGRRDLADGRRPAAQRLAIQRHHPSAGPGRPGGHDPHVRLAARSPRTTCCGSRRSRPRCSRSWKGR